MKKIFRIVNNQRGSAGFMGDGDQGGGTTPAGDQKIPDPAPNTDGVKYPEDLDKEYYGNPTILKHYDKEKNTFKLGELMKGLVHASSAIGKEKMLIPHKDFTEDQWKDTFKRLGVPEKLEEYSIKNNIPEGLNADEEMFKGFKETAHKLGILPKQAQGVLDYYNQYAKTSSTKALEAIKVEMQKASEGLKQEWGADYERNIKLADASLKEFASEEEIAVLKKSGYLDNPLFAKVFSKIGKAISEDKFVDSIKKDIGRSREEIQAEISSYYAENHPFRNSSHPQNAYYTERMMKLLESIHGKN